MILPLGLFTRISRLSLFFGSGLAFFAGLFLVPAGVIFMLPAKKRLNRFGRILLGVGSMMVLLSSVPLPAAFYLAFFGMIFIHVKHAPVSKPVDRLGVTAGIAVVAVSLAGLIAEWPRRALPQIRVPADTAVYVIGDSLSAGINPDGETTWPELLDKKWPGPVISLAQPGATLKTALRQVEKIPEGEHVVLFEIGGNDMLGGADSRRFSADLEKLLEKTRRRDRILLMFELPLPPLYNLTGAAQRRLARRAGVVLIPRRVLADVIASPENTVDGLHLSVKGHQSMARIVNNVLIPEKRGRQD